MRWEDGLYSVTPVSFEGRTHEAKSGGRTVVPVKAASRRFRQANPPEEASREREERKSNRSVRSQGAGKYCLRLGWREPYRKPTQVGRMSNLRRTSDLALRNSAKCTRNFGRSVAHVITIVSGRKQAQATVYQKHSHLRTSNGTYRW